MACGPRATLRDLWPRLPEESRSALLRRSAEADWWVLDALRTPWEAMRPLVFSETEYQRFAALASGVLRCALLACGRRAGTAGELYGALNDRRELRLLDPSQRLSAAGVLRMARPDALVVDGTPWFVELNIGPNIYGVPGLEERGAAFARSWPDGTLVEPPSTLRARAACLADVVAAPDGRRRRVLVPTWRADSGIAAKLDGTRALRRYLRPAAEAAGAAGLDVSVADLSQVHGGAGGLWVGDDRIDVVFNQFVSAVPADGRAVGVLRAAVLADAVQLFVPEASCLLSAKQVLAWMHEDLDRYAPADRELIRRHVPWTAWLGPGQSAERRRHLLDRAVRDRAGLVVKPSCGRGGAGFVAGHAVTARDWLDLLTQRSREHTLVLQHRLVPDRTWMRFRSRDGTPATAPVPFVLSPFLLDGRIAGACVRHPAPDTDPAVGPLNTATGAVPNTVLLLPGPADRPPRRPAPARVTRPAHPDGCRPAHPRGSQETPRCPHRREQ
ncbi:hypothetical protein QR97_12320 [Streptomyces sp. PBH53]|uniref:hypothetical protein n=1 Tax=Streptomyces sp. PBH53 TaxID=1577075 RepID=UPI00065508EE|nr:hypothetical protein [Streptomyces sp. PBH53]AKN70513.1 hypothetical protein QR97_12320 [Streptomyces sp. PBH53]